MKIKMQSGKLVIGDMAYNLTSWGLSPAGFTTLDEGVEFEAEGLTLPQLKETSDFVEIYSTKLDDFSSYREETCRNGGDYSYHQVNKYFCRLFNDRVEVYSLDWNTSSAEFSMADDGTFCSNPKKISFINADANYYVSIEGANISAYFEEYAEKVSRRNLPEGINTPVKLFLACKKAGIHVQKKHIKNYFRSRK